MNIKRLAIAALGGLTLTVLATSADALWRTAPTAAVSGGSMLLWTRSSETIQYAAGLPNAWNGASVNHTWGWPNGTRHRVQTQCTDGIYRNSTAVDGYSQYENVYYECPAPWNAWRAWGQLDQ